MQLFCVIVNDTGGAFTVEIGEDQPVWNLKDAIKKRKQNKLKDVDAADLRLFLAKKHSKNEAKGEGGDEEKWLTQLGAYDVIDTRDYIFLPFPGAKLKAVGLASDQLGKVSDEDAAVGRGHVHVLVEIVEEPVPRRTRAHSESDDQRLVKRQKATEAERWEWKEEEPVYYRKGRLFFVNREKAIEQLAALHEINFKRAIRDVVVYG